MGAFDLPRPPTRHRWTVADYERMAAEGGVLPPDGRYELIDGEVIRMAPIGTKHAAAVARTARAAERAAADRAIVWVQNPLQLGAHAAPEPDLALLRPRDDFYAEALPTAADVLLVIEVSHTTSRYDRDVTHATSRYDREVKLPLYARHGVPEVWLIDLDAGLLRLYRRPRDGEYLEVNALAEAGPQAVAALEGVVIDLSGVLG
jgi:Uma2 family endonuclease